MDRLESTRDRAMARRRRKHEEHTNHEAWAIPYGDLVTLLLALFVVLYSISSINQGKYRVLSEALAEAFSGVAKSIKPVQIGSHMQRGSDVESQINLIQVKAIEQSSGGTVRDPRSQPVVPPLPERLKVAQPEEVPETPEQAQQRMLNRMSDQLQAALGDLIKTGQVKMGRTSNKIEVEIGTDILFGSGSSNVAPIAKPILAKLAGVLSAFPLPLRIEGYTDNRPIHTAEFPSNWELSAARAASVVHLFMDQGVDPGRMSVAGYGEYRPVEENTTADSRNRNRRVLVVILTRPDELPASLKAVDIDGNSAAAVKTSASPATESAATTAPPTAPATSLPPTASVGSGAVQ
jgi:chemotaxis protein MotB